MPITDFSGDTFLAFIDISGFKNLMQDDELALSVLDRFYSYGYQVLRLHKEIASGVEGLFISDCGILFTRRNNADLMQKKNNLKSLLMAVKAINLHMRDGDILLKTSIAYGRFSYQQRIEFAGIEKNRVYGNAYVSAYIDNEKIRPKLLPGLCRITMKNLPIDIKASVLSDSSDEMFKLIEERRGDSQHLYFYWMLQSEDEIYEFESRYSDSDTILYASRLRILKGEL